MTVPATDGSETLLKHALATGLEGAADPAARAAGRPAAAGLQPGAHRRQCSCKRGSSFWCQTSKPKVCKVPVDGIEIEVGER